MISQWNHAFIEVFVAGLTAANQKDGAAAGIERKEGTIRLAGVLRAQLLHVRITRRFDCVCMRPSERRSSSLQSFDTARDGALFVFIERLKPCLKFIRILHFPHSK